MVITFISWFVGEVYAEGFGYSIVGLAMIASGVAGLVSYYNSDKIVLSISNAYKVSESENRDLHNLVENVCIAAGLPKPKIYMIDDTAMNAFATGRDPDHAVLCFTSGIVSSLEKRELEGVIAHELAHVGNYDIRLMSIVSILVGTITLMSDWITRGSLYGSSRRSRNNDRVGGLIMLIGIALIILSPIIATLIRLSISRNREYLADATAALITRYPKGLASALKRLAADREILEAANGATAHLYISNPLRSDVAGFMANLFNTHPPIEDRINRLESM
jgi:heat shock protein HtpX